MVNSMTKLKKMREGESLTRSQLSEMTGVSVRTIEGYEQGLRSIEKMQLGIALKISKALNCTMEDLLEM